MEGNLGGSIAGRECFAIFDFAFVEYYGHGMVDCNGVYGREGVTDMFHRDLEAGFEYLHGWDVCSGSGAGG